MKTIFLLTIALIFTTATFSQKKSKGKKTLKTAIVLANAPNIVFEMNKKNGFNQMYLLNPFFGATNDTLLIKSVPELTTVVPNSCKLKTYTNSTSALLNITWIENTITGDAKTKLENNTKINNEIWDVATRNQAFANIQSTTNIKEIVFLDRLKNASETQERNRKEGFEFTLLPNGDVSLANKSVVNVLAYNSADKKYKFKKK